MDKFLTKEQTATACNTTAKDYVFSSMWNQLAAQLPRKLAEGQVLDQLVALPGSATPTITMRKQRDNGLEKTSLAETSLPEVTAHYASIANRLHGTGKGGFTMTMAK